jgi:hypothetical protein
LFYLQLTQTKKPYAPLQHAVKNLTNFRQENLSHFCYTFCLVLNCLNKLKVFGESGYERVPFIRISRLVRKLIYNDNYIYPRRIIICAYGLAPRRKGNDSMCYASKAPSLILSSTFQIILHWLNSLPLASCLLIENLDVLRSGDILYQVFHYIQVRQTHNIVYDLLMTSCYFISTIALWTDLRAVVHRQQRTSKSSFQPSWISRPQRKISQILNIIA